MLSNGQFHKQESFLWYEVYYDECHECKLKTLFFRSPHKRKLSQRAQKFLTLCLGKRPLVLIFDLYIVVVALDLDIKSHSCSLILIDNALKKTQTVKSCK